MKTETEQELKTAEKRATIRLIGKYRSEWDNFVDYFIEHPEV